ncbi:hypothetical protein [Paenirhodobacter populi]|uniref:hypothetical protein n=1 Tax=Paenirhodobacter populi TaxID=2306993 RepID=UPI0013E3D63E|nr:hypothetical protein [Sinirhodobacter populi]
MHHDCMWPCFGVKFDPVVVEMEHLPSGKQHKDLEFRVEPTRQGIADTVCEAIKHTDAKIPRVTGHGHIDLVFLGGVVAAKLKVVPAAPRLLEGRLHRG